MVWRQIVNLLTFVIGSSNLSNSNFKITSIILITILFKNSTHRTVTYYPLYCIVGKNKSYNFKNNNRTYYFIEFFNRYDRPIIISKSYPNGGKVVWPQRQPTLVAQRVLFQSFRATPYVCIRSYPLANYTNKHYTSFDT